MARMVQFGFLIVMLAACAPVRIPTVVTPTSQPVQTQVPQTGVPTIALASKSPQPSPIATTPGTMKVKLYFVALEDKGKSGKKIGCDDSIIAVERAIPMTIAPLSAALRELFSIHDQYYGESGLYNALAPSNLKIESVSLVSDRVEIRLTGAVKLGGVCDNPRLEAQIKETVLQFPTVKSVTVFINDIPLEKILSEK